MTKKEKRYCPAELRAVTDENGGRHLSGYAAKYNTLSVMLHDEQLGEFYEVIVPGAFADAVGDDVTCNIDHDDSRLLGRTPNTLTLTDDETGLHFDCLLPDTAAGQTATVHVNRGDISKCSFAFDVLDEEWDLTEEGQPLRKLTKVRLYDTAIVIRPAYDFDAELSVRSLDLARAAKPTPVLEEPKAEAVEEQDADRNAWLRKKLDLALKS